MCLTDAGRRIVALSRGCADELGFADPAEARGRWAGEFVLSGQHDPDGAPEQNGVALVRRLDGTRLRFAWRVVAVTIDGAAYDLADAMPLTGGRAQAAPYVRPDAMLTRKEAATYASVSVKTIDRAIRSRDLRSTQRGRWRRIRRTWLDDWIGNGSAG